MDAPLSYQRYVPVRPTSNVVGSAFTGMITMRYQVPSGMVIKANECFLSTRMTLAASLSTNFAANPGPYIMKNFGADGDNTPGTPGPLDPTYIPANDTKVTTYATVSSNPVACLFDRVTLKINDVNVSTVDSYPISSTAVSLIGESKPVLTTSMSDTGIWTYDRVTYLSTATTYRAGPPVVTINPQELAVTTPAGLYSDNGTGDTVANYALINKYTYAHKKLLESPFSRTITNRINHRLAHGLWNSDAILPGGTTIQLEYQVQSNYPQNLIFGGQTATPSASLFTLNSSVKSLVVNVMSSENSNLSAAGTFGVYIGDMTFYMSMHDQFESIPKSLSFNLVEPWISLKTIISSNSALTFNPPKGTFKVLVCFVDSRYNSSSTVYNPCDFSPDSRDTTVNNAIATPSLAIRNVLQQISIDYAGQHLPVNEYNFPSGIYPDINYALPQTASYSTDDVFRAYQECFAIPSDALADSAGSLFDVLTWSYQPIFIFRVYTPAGDVSSTLDVNLKFINGVNPLNTMCCVIALHNRRLTMDYGDHQELLSVKVEDLH